MLINFVMSNNVHSGIFTAIIDYFYKYFVNDVDEIVVSDKPINDADIYHYHRPNLESNLRHNSTVTVHHDLEDFDPWFSIDNYIDRYKEAMKIICLNSAQQEYLKHHGLFDKTILIPHGVNHELFEKPKRPKQNISKIVKLGFVSKHYPRKVKGERYLYELVMQLNKNAQFILIGEGRYSDAEYLNGLGFETFCYESIPYQIMPIFYNEMDALLMLSQFEGGPANIPEALYSGTPIFSSRVGMMNDYKPSIEITGNIDLDAKAINRFIEDVAYRNIIFENSFECVNSAITWESVVEQHKILYKNLLTR